MYYIDNSSIWDLINSFFPIVTFLYPYKVSDIFKGYRNTTLERNLLNWAASIRITKVQHIW